MTAHKQSILNILKYHHIFLSIVLFATVAWLFAEGIMHLDYNWKWHRIGQYWLQVTDNSWEAGLLLEGLYTTLKISTLALLIALFFGIVLCACFFSKQRSIRYLALGYTQAIRCTPLLVQLYLLYFLFSTFLGINRFEAGVLSLACFEAAFVAEVLFSGIRNVPQEQVEAAQALSLPKRVYWQKIILPQALPITLPPLANLGVNLIKHSSIVTIIAIADLTDTARNIIAETFLSFEVWLTVGAVYFAICFPLATLITAWEKRLQR